MDKVVYQAKNVRSEIVTAIDSIVNPVTSTLGPRGNNVLFESDNGSYVLTNDGVTIAKNLSSKNRLHESIIDTVKEAALRTNAEGGDGTTTTTLLSGVLTKEAMKLVDEGKSWVEIRSVLNDLQNVIIKNLEKNRIKVDGKKGLKEIATISANNDAVIAENVIKAINVAGEDGMIFLHPNNKPETEIIEDLGFMIQRGVMYQELLTDPGRMSVVFHNAPVLLTDKKLYYAEEAETILRIAVKEKWKNVVIVARDFMGEALNTFIANHSKGIVQVMLVQADVTEKNSEKLQDLAVYIGGEIVTEKTGSLVNKLTPANFVMVNQVFSDPHKTLFTPKISASKTLKARIKMLKEELEEDKESTELKSRLASLTTGVVTLKIGGRTPMETRERIFRYEDAIHAVRSAMKHGYLVGGGLSLMAAFDPADCQNKEYLPLYRKYCEAVVRKIVQNASKHEDTVVEGINRIQKEKGATFGYNALTDTYEDLLKTGIIDPFLVVKMAVENSMSVANAIMSVEYYVINDIEDGKDEK